MTPHQRRTYSSFISLLVLLSMLAGAFAPLTSLDLARAQEVTPESSPEAEATTEAEATPAPTDPAPTVESTPEASPQPGETPAPGLPVLPVDPTLFMENFDDGLAQGFTLSEGWTVDAAGYLTATGPFETATISGLNWQHLAISARYGLTSGSAANIAFRVGADNFNVTIDSDGQAALYQGQTLLAEGVTPGQAAGLPGEATPEPGALTWYSVNVQALGQTVVVAVDNVIQINTTVEAVLPAGAVIFSTGLNNTGTVILDDVVVQQLAAPTETPAAPPTVVTPEATPVSEVTAEAIIEATAEATVEATPEVTAEADAEATPDAETTPEPETGPVIVLAADFETGADGWTLSDGASLVNGALLLAPGGSLRPADVIQLADLQIDLRAAFPAVDIAPAAAAAEATAEATPDTVILPDGLALSFRAANGGAYTLIFSASETALYRDGQLLAEAPAAHPADTGFAASLIAVGGEFSVTIDGAPVLSATDDSPLLIGEIAFETHNVPALVDDITVYDLSLGSSVTTPVPSALTEATIDKLSGALYQMVEAQLAGETETASAIAVDHYMTLDDQGRVLVAVWGANGLDTETVAALVTEQGGQVTAVYERYVEAFLSAELILAVANQDAVAAVLLPEAAVSTSGAQASSAISTQAGLGAVLPHSLDIIGASHWHAAGITGAGVRIGVIDTGFAGWNTGATAERACVGSTFIYPDGATGGSSHGVNVIEVICDVAPSSDVRLYRANSTDQLVNAINAAITNNVDVIVITIDTGIGGSTSGINPAIALATSADIPVIASAGNNGDTGTRPFTLQGEEGQGEALITTSAGSLISYTWDAGTVGVSSALYDGEDLVDSRPAVGDSQQYLVPESCGESCTLTLAFQGADQQTVTVAAASAGGENTIEPGEGLFPMASASSLTTAAESPESIAVGAVCAWQAGRYPLLSDSSVGAEGQANNASIKPEIVGPSFVSTSLVTASIDSVGGCQAGFNGTSAAAAHVAGMAALLFSNPSESFNSAFNTGNRPDTLQNYLMARAIDLNANGFDRAYGAGLSVLGNPAANLFQELNYTDFASDGVTLFDTSNSVYVGSITALTPDGSPTAPYVSPAYGIARAIATGRQYVIFQPREYVSSWEIPDPGAGSLQVLSFDGADLADRLPSTIFVVDSFTADTSTYGAVTIRNAQNVTFGGFQFTGANLLYRSLVPDANPGRSVGFTTPVIVINSSAVTVRDNTFTSFARPVKIDTSQNVTLTDNVFENFAVQSGAFGSAPFFDSAALEIDDSGNSAANVIRVFDNTFRNNSITATYNFNKWQEPVVGIERSYVNIHTSRFENNTAQAAISINQWLAGQEPATLGDFQPSDRVNHPVVVYSSLFDSNQFSGPLIHFYQGLALRFVNNTVANHRLLNDELGNIVLIGTFDALIQYIQDSRYEIHNNLFFNNETAGVLLGSAGASMGDDHRCLTIGTASTSAPTPPPLRLAARNNWFIGSVGINSSIPPGDCSSIDDANRDGFAEFRPGSGIGTQASPQNGNIYDALDINNETAVANYEAATFFMTVDPENPYRILPDLDDPDNTPRGVDAGLDSVVEIAAILGVQPGGNACVASRDFDVMGLARFIDRTPPLDEVPCNGTIDIGAYELSNPEPVSFQGGNGTIDAIGAEDTTALTFRVDSRVRGGYRPYTFQFSNLPAIYDPNPLNACGGQPIAFNDATYTVTYCPPKDFYTQGAPPEAQVSFNYTATGLLGTGTTPLGTVNLVLTPVNDGAPISGAPTQVVFTDSTPTDYRLQPYVTFSPFSFSTPATDNNPATPADVDYPFTFSAYTVDQGASGFNAQLFGLGASPSQSQMNTAIANSVVGGRLQFAPAPGEEGAIEFTYTVTDRDGQTASRRVRIVVTERLAGIGLHDDTSLDYVYNGGWTPYYYEPAINNTWHFTTNSNDSFNFYFIGDAFNLYLYGYAGGANYTLTLDPDDTGPLPPITGNLAVFSALACQSEPASGVLTTNVAVAGSFTYGCAGIDSVPGAKDQLRRLTITSTTPGGALILDAIGVRGVGLPEGEYEEIDFAMNYTGTWFSVATTGPAGGNFRYTNAIGANLKFKIDGDRVDTLVINRTMSTGWGDFDVYFNNVRVATVPNNAATTLWNQPYVIPGVGNGIVDVEIRNRTGFIGIESIELIAAQTVMQPGSYTGEDSRVAYIGNWITYNGAGPVDGALRYTVDTNAAAVFRINGNGVTINRTMASAWGRMQVCVGSNCQTFDSNSATLIWGQPGTSRSAITGEQTVIVRTLGTGPIGIDSITVLGAPTALGPGYYEETDSNILLVGDWIPWVNPPSKGGTAVYTNNPAASITFPVNPSLINRIALWHVRGAGWTTIRVCGTTCVTIPAVGGALQTAQSTLIQTSGTNSLGLSGTFANVTITLQGAGYIGIEAIQLLAPAGVLAPGYYEETLDSTAFNLTYSGTWVEAKAVGPRGGSYRYATANTDTATFSVIPDQIAGIVVYHTRGTGFGTMRVHTGASNPGSCPSSTCATVTNIPGALSYGNRTFIPKASLGLTGGSAVSVTIRPQGDGYIGLEALHIVSANLASFPTNLQTLPDGVNSATASQLRYIGTWAEFTATGTARNPVRYTSEAAAAIMFKINGNGVRIFQTMGSAWGAYEVCIDGNTCQIVTANNGGAVTYNQPVNVRVDTNGLHVVEIRSLGTGVFAIEAIEVLESAQPALANQLYEEKAPELAYSGLWYPLTAAGSQGGTLLYGNDLNGTITLRINATTTQRLVLYVPGGAGWGTMQVCRNIAENCFTRNLATAAGALPYGNAWIVQTGASGLNLAGTSATVTVRVTAGFGGLEAVQPLAGSASIPLAPGYYEETEVSTNYNLTYSATGWTTSALLGPRGGSYRYANSSAATATFSVIPDNITGIVVYHTSGPGFGTLRLHTGSNPATCTATCAEIENLPGVLTYGNRTFIPKASLGLSGGSAVTITLRPEGDGYIGLEALQITSANFATNPTNLQTLPAGRSSATAAQIRYVGTWTNYTGAGPISGTLQYSSDPSAAAIFKINGNGVAIYRTLAAAWGNIEVCIDGSTCRRFTSNSATLLWGQPIVVRTGSGGEHVVEVRSLDGNLIGIEAVDVLGPQAVLQPGEYNETEVQFEIGGPNYGWTPAYIPGARSNTLYYTNLPDATLSFEVNATAMTDLVIYHPNTNSGSAQLEVCSPDGTGTPCLLTSVGGATQYGVSTTFTKAQLGLTTGTATITIRRNPAALAGSYVSIEGVIIRGAASPLPVGYYEQDNFNLTYTGGAGAWITAPGTTFSGGSSVYSLTNNAAVSFQIATGTTGIVLFVSRGPTAGPMDVRICESDAPTTCPVNQTNISVNAAVTQNLYGYAFYGLQPDEPYTVTITNKGVSASQYLLIDSIAVLGQPTQTLNAPGGQPTVYDTSNSAVIYAPGNLWTRGTNAAGYLNGTYDFTASAGAVAQLRIEGNSLTVYQLAGTTSSRDVRFCAIISSAAGNSVQCSNYSQNTGVSTLPTPVTLYGFGFGTRDIVLENRDYGFYFLIDWFEVR